MKNNDSVDDKKTEQIEQTLQEAARLRSIRSKVSSISGLIILFLIVFLVVDTFMFIKKYETARIVEEVKNDLPRLTESLPMKHLVYSLEKEILPLYIDELSTKLRNSQPLLEQECYEVINNMTEEIGPALQQKVLQDLNQMLKETEVVLKERYPDLTETEVTLMLNSLQSEIQKQYPERIKNQVDKMYEAVNEGLDSLRLTETYKDLSAKNTPELEQLFLTKSLELLIYELNPEAGTSL